MRPALLWIVSLLLAWPLSAAPQLDPAPAQGPRPQRPVILVSGDLEAALGAELAATLAGPRTARLELERTGDERADWRTRLEGQPSSTPREVAAAIDGADWVLFRGGHAGAWWYGLRGDDRQGWIDVALRKAHRRGAGLVGLDGGADLLAWAGIGPRASLPPSRNPRAARDPEAVIGGMGLAAAGLVCRASSSEAPIERWLGAAHDVDARRALCFIGSVAWTYDPTDEVARVVGPGRIWMLDGHNSRRSADAWRGFSVQRLLAGDRLDLSRGRRPRLSSEATAPASAGPAPGALECAWLEHATQGRAERVLRLGSGTGTGAELRLHALRIAPESAQAPPRRPPLRIDLTRLR